MIRVELFPYPTAEELRKRIETATTVEELRTALLALLDHLH